MKTTLFRKVQVHILTLNFISMLLLLIVSTSLLADEFPKKHGDIPWGQSKEKYLFVYGNDYVSSPVINLDRYISKSNFKIIDHRFTKFLVFSANKGLTKIVYSTQPNSSDFMNVCTSLKQQLVNNYGIESHSAKKNNSNNKSIYVDEVYSWNSLPDTTILQECIYSNNQKSNISLIYIAFTPKWKVLECSLTMDTYNESIPAGQVTYYIDDSNTELYLFEGSMLNGPMNSEVSTSDIIYTTENGTVNLNRINGKISILFNKDDGKVGAMSGTCIKRPFITPRI